MVRRSVLWADCTVLLGPGGRGTTRYALARCARTDAASQSWRRALRARLARACAARRHTDRPCRVPPDASSGSGLFSVNTMGAAAKTVQGRPRCACEAPRSAAVLAARAARFND
jgi:hypothetical protein